MKFQAVSGVVCLLLFSCGEERYDGRQLPQKIPQKESAEQVPVEFNFTRNSGSLPQNIEMDITRTRKIKKRGRGIVDESYCPAKLPEDFVIGKAVCLANDSLSFDVTAGHTRQICMGWTFEQTKKIELSGCDRISVTWFGFKDGINIRF